MLDKILTGVVTLFIVSLGLTFIMFNIYVGLGVLSLFINIDPYQYYIFNWSRYTSLVLVVSSLLLVILSYIEKYQIEHKGD